MKKFRIILVVGLALGLLGSTGTVAQATSGLWGRPEQLVTIYTSTFTAGQVTNFHRILPNGTWEYFSCSESKNFILTGMRAIFLPEYPEDVPPFRLLVKVQNLTIFACELGELGRGVAFPAETGYWVGMAPMSFEPGIRLAGQVTVEIRRLPTSGDPDLGTLVRGRISLSMFGYYWP